MIAFLHLDIHIFRDGYACLFDDVEMLESVTGVFRVGRNGGWDETDLEVDINAFGGEGES